MAKLTAFPDKPTLASLTAVVRQMHDCMEARFDTAERDRARSWGAVMALAGRVEAITEALGLTPDGRKPMALWSPRKALVGFASVGAALFFAAKLIDAVMPYAAPLARALWRAAVGH